MNLKLEAIVVTVSEADRAKKHLALPLFSALQVDYHVALRLGATDQQIAPGGRFERFGLVVDIARDQPAFASVADPRAA